MAHLVSVPSAETAKTFSKGFAWHWGIAMEAACERLNFHDGSSCFTPLPRLIKIRNSAIFDLYRRRHVADGDIGSPDSRMDPFLALR